MQKRALFGRLRRAGGPVVAAVVASTACSDTFDASRGAPPRGTLGQEMFGVVCDRVGAQSLHEDLTGASYRSICHPGADGTFADPPTVESTSLPPLDPNARDVQGNPVPLDRQAADRAYGVARIEALGRHRADLVAALDATFPDQQIPVLDGTCQNTVPGGLHAELAGLLQRLQALYGDGTLPQTSQALAAVADALGATSDAQSAWARLDARAGYRPLALALGVARPALSYPRLREWTNATMTLLSADSDPYATQPQIGPDGRRVPVPGAAYAQLAALEQVAHAELANTTIDPTLGALATVADPNAGTVLNRPRTSLEVVQSVLDAQDPAFGAGTPRYIVERDGRGYALVPPVGGSLPPPFQDEGDGLPKVDPTTGLFVTTGTTTAPSPLPVGPPDALFLASPDSAPRDALGRALIAPGSSPLYAYVDTSRTFAASVLRHVGAFVDPDPAHQHETLMDALAGLMVIAGARDGSPGTTRAYADGETVAFKSFQASHSPLVDLVYALGQVLSDPSADDTLALAGSLATQRAGDLARTLGDVLYAKDLANADTAAHIPATSTLWDELIDLAIQIEQEPGLLADVLRAFGDDASLGLGHAFGDFMIKSDDLSYDRNDVNGPIFNLTTKDSSPPKTPVNRAQADSGSNRSLMSRFLQTTNDTWGVATCNKEGAIVHSSLTLIPGNPTALDLCASTGGGGNIGVVCPTGSECTPAKCNGNAVRPFHECEVFKIDNLAKFFIDSIVGEAELYFRPALARAAGSVSSVEFSGLGSDAGNGPEPDTVGFWDPSSSLTLRPKPAWLSRLVNFDLSTDSPNMGDKNFAINQFVSDLQGADTGTAVCPERAIADPCNNDSQCGSTNTVAGVASDGMVHGLRACADGDWLLQRDKDGTFVTEADDFLRSLTPLATAFVNHGREDLLVGTMQVLAKHWQGLGASTAECRVGVDAGGKSIPCARDGADTYEPLVSSILSSDVFAALNALVKSIANLQVPACAAVDPKTHKCSQAATKDGVTVLADATVALVDPGHAKQALTLADRTGSVTSRRNDGTTNPQVTPLYLVLEALDEVDSAFAQYAQSNPQDAGRQAQWRRARSQLMDELFATTAPNAPSQAFKDPAASKILPVIVDALRAQRRARCTGQPAGPCAWAHTDLANNLAQTVGGPTFATLLDLAEAIRKDDPARTELDRLVGYLAAGTSPDDAAASLVSTVDDLVQVLRDDTNLVPLYHVLAAAAQPGTDDAGNPTRSLIDATTALLSRTAGHAVDDNGNETCGAELDPNGVVSVALRNLVRPMGAPTSVTPLEVIIDTFADVNRAAGHGPTDKLAAGDYANMSGELSAFLKDKQSGLPQLYEIVRQGTVH
ncbi:MAG TPA: hypothetical protein VKU41_16870 [Polyangiaceae bacterium]|nr:hypothetical protein [Polyangiaceae bacterium]